MENFDIYNDIAKRTNGDVYIGVVGPVRTGKSTFISKFMKNFLLENITEANEKQRTIDEMPQSGSGKNVMTMQPKFIPNEAVEVKFGGEISAKVRLIDCVGYIVPGAGGFEDDGELRMVKTPWSDEEMPFEEAAEIGTHKVISEHSTIAVLVTTDGTISGIDRENYLGAEERVVAELKQNKKPFIILLNSKNPTDNSTIELQCELSKKYSVPVVLKDVSKLEKEDINEIIKKILLEFSIQKINIKIPKWIQALDENDPLVQSLMKTVREATIDLNKMSDYETMISRFEQNENIEKAKAVELNLATGEINFELFANSELFYKVLGKESGETVENEFELLKLIKELSKAKQGFDKIKTALSSAEEGGYGVVLPSLNELVLDDPQIVTKNGNSSLKLRATAPSYHIIKVDVSAEICPAVGSVNENGALIQYMMNEFENNKEGLWNKNMFGKPMNELVKESIDSKIAGLPEEVQVKMKKTLTKIVNERKGGVICILL
ncbi:MAG: stage IV sporulation protein A [Clostridia bacterium]|nr:stage IV sporulation protein A [Clostridia bacterium]